MPPHVILPIVQAGPSWPLKRRDDNADLDVAPGCTSTVNHPTLVVRQDGSPATVTVTEVPAGGGGGGRGADNLSGGAIAGIVIGSIVGTLLLLWIIRSLCNLGARPREPEPWYRDKDRHHHHHHRHHSPHRHSRSRRRSSSISAPPPVVIHDYSRSPRRPSRGRY
ncbi:hypothetical protein SODALDRAFT_327171 [Sodiomyces alkalinus F11]|uniref:Uncharacterized protein n=1 Tax=Sodiomyces alkalinus (strain CBS 110278 / VKM F-3762 / F11) TaxID=1314773 RepID=A0A3N2Q8B9_SODAK|nr:hypothetical protein SODALDRAFT_327171 [Sodiomyces alkalinus F11]ROT43002.1 hypothetical protein SODALDRAFT_327171 [Sodiomyces alkalinus F11]